MSGEEIKFRLKKKKSFFFNPVLLQETFQFELHEMGLICWKELLLKVFGLSTFFNFQCTFFTQHLLHFKHGKKKWQVVCFMHKFLTQYIEHYTG